MQTCETLDSDHSEEISSTMSIPEIFKIDKISKAENFNHKCYISIISIELGKILSPMGKIMLTVSFDVAADLQDVILQRCCICTTIKYTGSVNGMVMQGVIIK